MIVAVAGLVKIAKTSGKCTQMSSYATGTASDALDMVAAGIDDAIGGNGLANLRGASGTVEDAVHGRGCSFGTRRPAVRTNKSGSVSISAMFATGPLRQWFQCVAGYAPGHSVLEGNC